MASNFMGSRTGGDGALDAFTTKGGTKKTSIFKNPVEWLQNRQSTVQGVHALAVHHLMTGARENLQREHDKATLENMIANAKHGTKLTHNGNTFIVDKKSGGKAKLVPAENSNLSSAQKNATGKKKLKLAEGATKAPGISKTPIGPVRPSGSFEKMALPAGKGLPEGYTEAPGLSEKPIGPQTKPKKFVASTKTAQNGASFNATKQVDDAGKTVRPKRTKTSNPTLKTPYEKVSGAAPKGGKKTK